MFVTHRYFYQVYDSTGATGDTVPVPSLPNILFLARANYLINEEGGAQRRRHQSRALRAEGDLGYHSARHLGDG